MNDLIERLRYEAVISDRPGQPDRLHALADEFAAALKAAAREDACVALVADIRFACGDNGKRSQPELLEYIRGLARDAARYRWLRDGASMITDLNPWEDVGFVCAVFVCTEYGSQTALTGEDLDAAIDSAMQRTSGGAA